MPNIFTSLAVGLTMFAVADGAQAAVIETWQFSQGGYTSLANEFPGEGTLNGSFTGTVEPNGFIELGDLTNFTASWSFDPASVSLVNLRLFSFNTEGSGSTLAIEGIYHLGSAVFCIGAVTTLDPMCGAASLPAGSNGFDFFGAAVTPDVASATLVSTVPAPLIGHGLTATLAVGGLLVIAGLWERKKRVSQRRPATA